MSQLETNTASLQVILEAVNSLPEAGSGEPVLQDKTVTPSTSAQTVTPDSGYDGLSKVTVNAMTTVTQATPSITVSTSGKITASATQTAGYVAAGTKSATKQLTTQAAQTITPGTTKKTIASGRYLTGTQTIKGDANLVSGNIKSGVSIFGVTGSYEGSSSSSGGSMETCTVTFGEYLHEEIHYTSGDGTIAVGSADTSAGASLEICKNTIVFAFTSGSLDAGGVWSTTGGVEVLSRSTYTLVLEVTGDGTVSYSTEEGPSDPFG